MMDCIRCRRNALFETTHAFPVFSPLDTIEVCTGTLGDLTFISKPVRWQGGGSLLSNLPFQGNGWYSRVAAEWMLHCGICQWEHCTHVLNASARHPPGYLREALTKIESALEDDLIRKTSINSWIGTLAIEQDTAYCLRSSGCQADLEPLGNGECLKIQTT
jgi:hypothetical protein